ncbi:uncharacterized protein DMENIID0001_157300 [Sergentomyia squamirostris]
MSRMEDWEKAGLRDFFTSDIRAEAIAIDMAKFFSGRVSITSPKTSSDAIDKILHHCESVQLIMDKKAVTKDILSNYLMQKGICFSPGSTKQTLIQRILHHWRSSFKIPAISASPEVHPPAQEVVHTEQVIEELPVNVLSRQFAVWFFRKLNETSLTLNDLWPDAQCVLRVTQNDSVTDDQAHGCEAVLEKLLETKKKFQITFNPNINLSGVQGRISPHGLVLVVCCGTLHVVNRWVGVFESAFQLVQDPSTGPNNWKCKNVKIELRSTQQEMLPTLNDCLSIQDIVELPIENQGNLPR